MDRKSAAFCACLAAAAAAAQAPPAEAQTPGQQMTNGAGRFAIELEALYMTREAKRFEFTRDSGSDERFFADVDRDWKPGARVTAGMRSGPRTQVELSAFFLRESEASTAVTPTVDTLQARFTGAPYPGVAIVPTIPAAGINIFGVAQAQDMVLRTQLHGAEVNYRYRMESARAGLQGDVLVGLRYVELRDRLRLHTETPTVGSAADLRINARNHLYGVQAGMDLRYAPLTGLTLGLGVKGGVFANDAYRSRQMDFSALFGAVQQNIYYDDSASTELAAVIEGGPSVSYALMPGVSVFAGYQLLWLKGVTLAPNHYLGAGLIEQRSVLADSSLLYHGARAGVSVRF